MPRADMLLLDDGSEGLRTLSAILHEAFPRSEIPAAATPAAALTILATGGIDAILIPPTFDEQDAISVGRRLLQEHPTPPVPLILLTRPDTPAETLQQALEAGFRSFLPLAAHPAEVRATIDLVRGAPPFASGSAPDAERRYVAVGRLAGGVAHDFNNALTGIMGYAALARELIEPDDPIHAMLDQIIKGADRAAVLARHLLTFARKPVLHPRRVDLNTVVDDTERMLRRVLKENVDLEIRPSPDLTPSLLDPTTVEQILVHLVVDAGDSLPRGGSVSITTEPVEDPHPGVAIIVSAHPASMDDDTAEIAVTPPDRGFGHEIAGEIAARCGGTLRTRTDADGDASVVEFPRGEYPRAETRPHGSTRLAPAADETILLVDDDDLVLRMAEEALATAGYRVLAAHGSRDALRLCREHDGPIDLVLTDVVMPVMNGPRMVRRARDIRPELRALYMSGYADDALAMDGGLEEDAVLMEKPFSSTRLIRVVRQVLSGEL